MVQAYADAWLRERFSQYNPSQSALSSRSYATFPERTAFRLHLISAGSGSSHLMDYPANPEFQRLQQYGSLYAPCHDWMPEPSRYPRHRPRTMSRMEPHVNDVRLGCAEMVGRPKLKHLSRAHHVPSSFQEIAHGLPYLNLPLRPRLKQVLADIQRGPSYLWSLRVSPFIRRSRQEILRRLQSNRHHRHFRFRFRDEDPESTSGSTQQAPEGYRTHHTPNHIPRRRRSETGEVYHTNLFKTQRNFDQRQYGLREAIATMPTRSARRGCSCRDCYRHNRDYDVRSVTNQVDSEWIDTDGVSMAMGTPHNSTASSIDLGNQFLSTSGSAHEHHREPRPTTAAQSISSFPSVRQRRASEQNHSYMHAGEERHNAGFGSDDDTSTASPLPDRGEQRQESQTTAPSPTFQASDTNYSSHDRYWEASRRETLFQRTEIHRLWTEVLKQRVEIRHCHNQLRRQWRDIQEAQHRLRKSFRTPRRYSFSSFLSSGFTDRRSYRTGSSTSHQQKSRRVSSATSSLDNQPDDLDAHKQRLAAYNAAWTSLIQSSESSSLSPPWPTPTLTARSPDSQPWSSTMKDGVLAFFPPAFGFKAVYQVQDGLRPSLSVQEDGHVAPHVRADLQGLRQQLAAELKRWHPDRLRRIAGGLRTGEDEELARDVLQGVLELREAVESFAEGEDGVDGGRA